MRVESVERERRGGFLEGGFFGGEKGGEKVLHF